MPTGYTSDIYEEKDITFKEFVFRCARGFGALIHQRDDAPNDSPKHRVISPYHKDRLEELNEEYLGFSSMGTNALQKLMEDEVAASVKYVNEYIEKKNNLEKKYREFLDKARNWESPSPDHDGLKTLVIEQLEESIKFDCDHDFIPPVVSYESVEEFRQKKLDSIRTSLSYHMRELENDAARVKESNKWIDLLYASLEDY